MFTIANCTLFAYFVHHGAEILHESYCAFVILTLGIMAPSIESVEHRYDTFIYELAGFYKRYVSLYRLRFHIPAFAFGT